jgi:hypothetical protein
MVSLVDIGPATSSVTIRGKDVEVIGMTAEHIVKLFIKVPELRRLVTGKADEDVMTTLFNTFPHLLGQITAACVGGMDNPQVIEAASNLSLGEQWMLIEASMKITFPQGVGNFLDGLLALMGQKGVGSGWAQAMTSPAQSSAASAPAVPNANAGTPHQDSSLPGSS